MKCKRIAELETEINSLQAALESESVALIKEIGKTCGLSAVNRRQHQRIEELTAEPDKHEKPPLGCKPKWLHDEERIKELAEAIARYAHQNADNVMEKAQKWARLESWADELQETIHRFLR